MAKQAGWLGASRGGGKGRSVRRVQLAIACSRCPPTDPRACALHTFPRAAFMTYSALGYQLTASVAFPALALFNLLRFPVMMFPQQASGASSFMGHRLFIYGVCVLMPAALPSRDVRAAGQECVVVCTSVDWRADAPAPAAAPET